MEPARRDELSPELRAFLYSCIDAVEQLEILIALRRSGLASTTRGLAADLGLADTLTRRHLETLTARGLLRAQPGNEVTYHFEPRTPELGRYVSLLADAHANHRGALLRFVAARLARTKSFADAFRLRDSD
jgi:DNA-binding IclR family transcriptional regulator